MTAGVDLPIHARGVIAFVVAGLGDSVWLDVDAAMAQLTFAGHKTALETIRRDFIARPPDPLCRIIP